MGFQFKQSSQEELAEILSGEREVSHVEFAGSVLSSHRLALSLNVPEIRELAAAILVLDHSLQEANSRMATMLAENKSKRSRKKKTASTEADVTPKQEIAPINSTQLFRLKPDLKGALDEMIKAVMQLEQDMYSKSEKAARQNFEKAAMNVAEIYHPKKRKKS